MSKVKTFKWYGLTAFHGGDGHIRLFVGTRPSDVNYIRSARLPVTIMVLEDHRGRCSYLSDAPLGGIVDTLQEALEHCRQHENAILTTAI